MEQEKFKIRCVFGKYALCDGKGETETENDFCIGTLIALFDTFAEAVIMRDFIHNHYNN